ncbi:zinc finger protein ZAT4-like [Cynara cardunculus var. scolymus]|uniref:zinc finger protein ZAT4-like n=1 Tax=Cynara cardunculus var. scolymus TaxID=59895 RepID=UPI000D62DD32|nr:zinc finger protein ZAT4-like [Cynara cardunculus var. scolymus]
MASADDQQTNFKHFCRICKKGFMCGRALGGHMRAHGIGDDTGNLDDEDPVSDWEDKQGNKRMYALRTNPNRLKSCRVCENCGKEFLSWKSFLEHRKCSSDDGESLVSSPESEADDDDGYDDDHHGDRRDCGGGASGWSKRKRSLRAKVGSFNSICPSSEDEDLALAKCLMELSNARVDPVELTDVEDSCASPSREEQRRNPMFTKPAFLTSPFTRPPPPLDHKAKGIATTPKGMFECKACKKVFNSHQALGGHRASHKKVKGCFAARNDQFADDSIGDDDVITHDEFFPSPKPMRKSRVHKCSICNRIFASGQALGGHKRCHWLTSNMSDTSSLAKFNFHEHIEQLHRRALALPSQILNKSKALDLNLPAPADDIAGLRRDPRYPLSFEVSTEINLHSWNVDHENDDRKNTSNHEKEAAAGGGGGGATMEDDEADSKVKLAKLSELKDMKNISGSSSSWLQVGIGTSTTDVGPSGPSHDT